MRGVYSDFQGLQPVALPQSLECEGLLVRCPETIKGRKKEGGVLWPKYAKMMPLRSAHG